MAATELVHLIDLSLGEQPSGVVNFNYLHNLLHEIVKRLVSFEEQQQFGIGGVTAPSLHKVESIKTTQESAINIPKQTPLSDVSLPQGVATTRGEDIDYSPTHHPSEQPTDVKDAMIPPQHSSNIHSDVKPSNNTIITQTESDVMSRPSSTVMPRPSSRLRTRSSIVSAANDLGYLEKKLHELETRVNTMETIPEMLERKGSDITATPVRDMWNFTNLTNRIGSAEDGIDKTSQLVDDLLGEVQSLKQQIGDINNSFDERFNGLDSKLSETSEQMENKLKELETLKLAVTSDSPSDAFMGLLGELQQKFENLQQESVAIQEKVNTLESSLANLAQLSALQDSFDTTLAQLQQRMDANELEQSKSSTIIDERVDQMTANIEQITAEMKLLETALSEKVNVSDLSSLMPSTDGSEGANFMPKLLEIQNKITQLEDEIGKQPPLPSDLLDKIIGMQNAIDHLSAELNRLSGMVSGGSDSDRVEELGSQLAQMKERIEELDRAVAALTSAISQQQVTPLDDESINQYVDLESFNNLKTLVQDLQQEQERLLGTAAHLSHELEINQEHVKTLYSAVDDVRAIKADKDQLAIEVDEKADRAALEAKASRDWVDSTFERLDKEIREAKSHLIGQEEALRNAVEQINEDVEGKLDRMEIEPLKQYFDKKIQRIKTAPVEVEKEGDDAAGFRKPLRFRCISCDKPVGMKPNDVIPTLPHIDMLPGTRTFRPYTTYELELIRRHQRVGQLGVVGSSPYSMSIRSAGGSHTVTRPHQRIRVAPFNPVFTAPEPPIRTSPPVHMHDEMDIVGHDGHIYKGRTSKHNLPPIMKPKFGRNRSSKFIRPSSTTPIQPIQS